jgi:hypothetical protein
MRYHGLKSPLPQPPDERSARIGRSDWKWRKRKLCVIIECMREELIRDSVQLLILTIVNDFPHDHCWDCECFQNFIDRIEREGQKDAAIVIEPLKVPKERIRASFGCESCPVEKASAFYAPGNGIKSMIGAGQI